MYVLSREAREGRRKEGCREGMSRYEDCAALMVSPFCSIGKRVLGVDADDSTVVLFEMPNASSSMGTGRAIESSREVLVLLFDMLSWCEIHSVCSGKKYVLPGCLLTHSVLLELVFVKGLVK